MEGLFWGNYGHHLAAIPPPTSRRIRHSAEASSMPPKSWGLGQRPGRRQTLTSARCGTIRKPTTPATGKPDHNSDNHPKSPDLKVVKPYDINSARNSYRLCASFGEGVWGVVSQRNPSTTRPDAKRCFFSTSDFGFNLILLTSSTTR